MDLARALAYFSSHEGRVNHMYLDVRGLVTVGVGRMLASVADAQTLLFMRRAAGIAASASDIGVEWNTIKGSQAGHAAAYYEKYCSLMLPESAIDQELERDIDYFCRDLRKRFPAFDTFPDGAQLGLLDLAFSMGEKELFAGYPKLCAAADRLDWNACAAECSRSGVSDSRNADCAALFLS